MTAPKDTIIVYATEDHRYPALEREAIDIARSAEARLVFYDIDSGSLLTDPRPNFWAADTDEEAIVGEHQLMDANHLEARGRGELAKQVKRARGEGIEAFGWLPGDKSLDTLVEYADEQGASVILVPAELAESSLVERLRGRSLDHLEKRASAPLVVVDKEGNVETHGPTPVGD